MGKLGLLGKAGFLGGTTVLSRLLALVRDMGMAWLLGAGPVADCLVAALRVPHAVRRLLGEGSLSMTLTAWLANIPQNALRKTVRALHWRFGLLLGALLLVLVCCSVQLAEWLMPGFDTQQQDLASTLLRLALPYIFWAGLAALGMATLHSLGIFGPSALSPIVCNLTMLGFTLAAAVLPLPPAHTLALGMSCGGLAQWMIQWRAMRYRLASSQPPLDAELPCKISFSPLRNLPAGFVGAASPQLVLLAAMGLASTVSPGQVTALYYAERILELPLGVVGVCLGMASLPVLSQHAACGEFADVARVLRLALRWALWLSLAAMAGLWAVGDMLVALLFGHGNFSGDAVHATWGALALYLPAIPACALGRNLLAASNALGLTLLTAKSSLAALCVTLLGGLVGLSPALAGCLGLWVQPVWLWLDVRRELARHGQIAPLIGVGVLLQGTIAALATGSAAWWVQTGQQEPHLWTLLVAVCAGVLSWGVTIFLSRRLTCAAK